ncbi:formin-like protein 5 [Penaeus monodon]|uniref:formin-like protein 5 n=1 Tax=Penaeus monodon TaxID=6687 RepID=UPI0018A7B656|nr:formin-like protein 5 [Penaeus monodon]
MRRDETLFLRRCVDEFWEWTPTFHIKEKPIFPTGGRYRPTHPHLNPRGSTTSAPKGPPPNPPPPPPPDSKIIAWPLKFISWSYITGTYSSSTATCGTSSKRTSPEGSTSSEAIGWSSVGAADAARGSSATASAEGSCFSSRNVTIVSMRGDTVSVPERKPFIQLHFRVRLFPGGGRKTPRPPPPNLRKNPPPPPKDPPKKEPPPNPPPLLRQTLRRTGQPGCSFFPGVEVTARHTPRLNLRKNRHLRPKGSPSKEPPPNPPPPPSARASKVIAWARAADAPKAPPPASAEATAVGEPTTSPNTTSTLPSPKAEWIFGSLI